ncbi:MAG: NADH-cytochrome b5 reductase [Claussenomyces sp. TS43310]|nr:MAG: NADH-cytochrome b5 reductase [Claussenomyces sp. TS43310]
MSAKNPYLSKKYVDGVYIPSSLLIVGCLIVKRDWLPYAVTLALLLGGLKVYSNSTCCPQIHAKLSASRWKANNATGAKKILKPDAFQEFELKEKTIISHNVAIYRFGLPSENSILGLPIGQHISLAADLDVHIDPKVPTSGTAKKEIVRSYTPISGDHQPGYFDLLIKSYPTGNISKHMASMVVGQMLKVRGPKGAMVYTPNMVRHFGMIAGGTGITPMLQIIKAVIRGRSTGDKTEIDLLFANVNPEDILLKEDLDELAQRDKGFRVHYVLNNPPENWKGGVGFVTPEMIQQRLPKPADDVKVLLCGPPPMISAMKKATEGLGFRKARPVSKLEDQVFAF